MRSFWAEVFGQALSELIMKLLTVGAFGVGVLAVAGVVDMPRLLGQLAARPRERDAAHVERAQAWTPARTSCATPACGNVSLVSSAPRPSRDDPYTLGTAVRPRAARQERVRDERPVAPGIMTIRPQHTQPYDAWQSEQASLTDQARRVVARADRGGACEVKHRLHNLSARGAARWLDRRSLQQMQPLIPRLETLCPQLDPVPFQTLLQRARSPR